MSSKESGIVKFGPLVMGDEMNSVYNSRSKTQIFQTVTAASWELINAKVEIAEKEGWGEESLTEALDAAKEAMEAQKKAFT